MTRQRDDLVRRLYEGLSAAGPDLAMADLIAEDAVFDYSRRKLDPGVVRGRAAIVAAARELAAPWDPYSVDVEQLFDVDDGVLALVTVRGRGRASGIDLTAAVAHLWKLRDGKVVAMVYYAEREEALAAHGLPR
jgi:ketosteroid isomerase-like protein